MYQRSERAQWFYEKGGSSFSRKYGIWINGTYVRMKDLQNYARLFPEDFVYVDKGLYSPDMKIAYGYAVDGDDVWRIPESVEIFDNIFDPAEGFMDPNKLREVYIGKNLREITDVFGCFGMRLRKVHVAEENEYFTSVNGCLYSKNRKEFIYYPPKHTDECFTICDEAEVVKKSAVVVSLLPEKFVIPASVKVLEKDWLWELYDKGFDMTREEILEFTIEAPRHLKKDIESIWADYKYGRPNIVYK